LIFFNFFFTGSLRQPDGKNLGAQEINQANFRSFRIQREAHFSEKQKMGSNEQKLISASTSKPLAFFVDNKNNSLLTK